MTKKTVRTGIVGSGFSASFHYEMLRKVYGTNVEVIGVHSRERAAGPGLLGDSRHPVLRSPRCAARRSRGDPRLCAPDGPRGGGGGGTATRQVCHLREAADRLFRRRLGRFPLGPGRQAGGPGGRAWPASIASWRPSAAARDGYCMPKTGSMPRPFRKSGRSWKRPAGKSFGFTARRPTAARTRWTTPTRPVAAAACSWARAATR